MKRHYHDLHANTHWLALRQRLIDYGIMQYGQFRKLAQFLDIYPSYVHRWLCPICEHGNIPTYYLGKEIERYLDTIPFEEVQNSRPKTGNRKCTICTLPLTEHDQTSGKVRMPDGKFKKVFAHLTCVVAFGRLQ